MLVMMIWLPVLLSLSFATHPGDTVRQQKPNPAAQVMPADPVGTAIPSARGDDLMTRIRAAQARIGQGDCAVAERELSQLQGEVSGLLGADSELALEVLGGRALALECAGQTQSAMALVAGRYAQSLSRFGPDSWTTDTFRMLESFRLARAGQTDEALLLMRASFDLRLRSPRANATEREQLGALLGAIYRSRGQENEAREVLALSSPDGPAGDLMALYLARGQGHEEAVAAVAERMMADPALAPAIRQLVRVEQVHALQTIGWRNRDSTALERAEAVAREALASAGPKPEAQASAARALGLTLTSDVPGYRTPARLDEGLALLRQAVQISDAAFGPGVPLGVDSRLDLAARLQAHDRAREAEVVLAPLAQIIAADPYRLTPDARATVAVGQALAALDTQGLAPAYGNLRHAADQREAMILARSADGQGQRARHQFVDLFRAQVAFAWFLADDLTGGGDARP